MKHALMITLTGLMFATLVGCQSASRPWWAEGRIQVRDMREAGDVPTPRVHRMRERVHVVLADYAVTPVTENAAAVALGAGDPLGRQIFERYALAVELERRRRDEPKLADAATSPWFAHRYTHVLAGR